MAATCLVSAHALKLVILRCLKLLEDEPKHAPEARPTGQLVMLCVHVKVVALGISTTLTAWPVGDDGCHGGHHNGTLLLYSRLPVIGALRRDLGSSCGSCTASRALGEEANLHRWRAMNIMTIVTTVLFIAISTLIIRQRIRH